MASPVVGEGISGGGASKRVDRGGDPVGHALRRGGVELAVEM
jgi:hypothetical protein